jgi:glycosyltransferase involved in cell wall biosynthesis
VRAGLGIRADERVLLVMGVFQDRKAQLALVHAFAPLAAAHPDAVLVLVGYHPSPYGDAVRRTVDELGLTGSIRIEDIHPDTYRWYRAADVLVSASDIESLPRSILEAMAFGVPVAAASVFGVPEVLVDGANGWLFEPRHGDALVAALRRVLAADDAHLAALGNQARRDAHAFDGQGYASEYHKLIVDLAAEARP